MGKGGDSGIGEILSAKTTTTAASPTNAAAVPIPGAGRPVIPAVDPSPRVVGTAGPAKRPPTATVRPWYARGGFHVNEIGMGANVLVPPAVLLATASGPLFGNDGLLSHNVHPGAVFGVLLALQMIHAFAAEGMRTTFCIVVAPVYVTTLLVVPWTLGSGAWMAVAAAVAIGIWRGALLVVCLSSSMMNNTGPHSDHDITHRK